MKLSDLLTPIDMRVGDLALVAVDQTTRFVIVATEGDILRVDSAYRRVVVPMHDWRQTGEDDAAIVRVLVEASMANPVKVSTPKAIDANFWVKNRGWYGLLCNPGLLGKFEIPEGPYVAASELVDLNQIVFIGSGAGFYVRQGNLRGVVSNRVHGLMQVQFAAVP